MSSFIKKITLISTLFLALLALIPVSKAAVGTDILDPGGVDSDDYIGYSVAIDGNRAVVGAPFDNDGGSQAGAVYIYQYNAGIWGLETKITPVDADENDNVGWSVDIEGGYVAFTARQSGNNAGAAYVYYYGDDLQWHLSSKLVGSDVTDWDRFGNSISINGAKVVVGGPDAENYDGVAYVFRRINETNWTQEAKLVASDAAQYDDFGEAVEISGDNIVIGAPGNDDNGSNTGSAYIFWYNGSNWVEQEKILPASALSGDYIGKYVSIDNDYAIIGAHSDDHGWQGHNDGGSAYIYYWNGSSWGEQAKLEPTLERSFYFGKSVGISGDYAVVVEYEDRKVSQHIASLYHRSGTTWTLDRQITGGKFWRYYGGVAGELVDFNGTQLIFGAYRNNDNEGEAFLYDITEPTGADITADFTDSKFLDCISRRLGSYGSVYTNDAANLKELRIMCATLSRNKLRIDSIAGAQHLTGLTYMDVGTNMIEDISPLSGLTNLEYLYLDENRIVDISPLSGLSNLIRLDLTSNKITTGVSSLSGLTSVERIELDDNYITDASDFSGWGTLSNLTFIDLRNNLIADTDGFIGLNGIPAGTYLYAGNNAISDLSGLSGMTNLTTLDLSNERGSEYKSNNTISDLGPINGLTGLTSLQLDNNNVGDSGLLSIRNFDNLTSLNLYGNNLSDLSVIGSSNPNLVDFASSLSLNVEYNESLTSQANYQNSLSEILTIEANGAWVSDDISWEDCTNSIDDDGDTLVDYDDPYCIVPEFYIGSAPTPPKKITFLERIFAALMPDTLAIGGGGAACGNESNPCASLWDLGSSNSFTSVLKQSPYNEDVTIYIGDGATASSTSISADSNANSVTIKPWNDSPEIIFEDSVFIGIDGAIIEGFEINNRRSGNNPGLRVEGENIIVRNNYIHGNPSGIASYNGKNIEIYNNILVGNQGGYYDDNVYYDFCGGIVLGDTTNVTIMNNTLYNNCDSNDNLEYELGEIALSAISRYGTTGPINTTVKQNFVFNDLGGYKYYFDVGTNELINGSTTSGLLTDANAVSHGGDNFIATTNPFENYKGGSDWVDAAAAYALTSAVETTYQIATMDVETPATDYLGNARPNGAGEAGAIENVARKNESSGQTNPSCNSDPIKLDLPEELSVSIIDGNPVVNLNWANIQETNTETKVNVLLNYLSTNPSIGEEGKKLMNVFTTYIRDKILEDDGLTEKYYNELENMNLSDLTNCNCDKIEARNMYKIVQNIRKNARLKGVIDKIISIFVKDLLNLEQTLKEAGEGKTPFTDFYKENSTSIGTEGVIKIYRNGKLLNIEENANNTSYTDRTIPANTTGKVKYYNYYLVNETDCGSETGDKGGAQINPVVTEGTEIDVGLDLKIKVKESYGELIMEGVHRLIQSTNNGNGNIYSEEVCMESKDEFLEKKNGTNLLNYILECYAGERSELRHKIEREKEDIITPLMLLLTLNRDNGVDKLSTEEIVDSFMLDKLNELNSELVVEGIVLQNINNLGFGDSLLNKETIDDLTEEEKELLLQIDENYFGKLSHAADIIIEVYNGENMIKSIKGHTNLLGEAEVGLGTLLAGTEYTLKVRLVDEKFVLPKIVTLEINNAEPKNDGSYEAEVALEFDKHFKYGNFDESDDVIDKDDLIAWGKLLQNNPELWSDVNIDGLTGINLLDVITLQENWGNIEKMDIEENDITLKELLNTFGLSISSGFSGSSSVEVPTWVQYAEIGCK